MRFFFLILLTILVSVSSMSHAQRMQAQPQPAPSSYAPYKHSHSKQYCIPNTGLATRNQTSARASVGAPQPSQPGHDAYLRDFQQDLSTEDWEALVQSYRDFENQSEFGRGVLSDDQFDDIIEDVIREKFPSFSDFNDTVESRLGEVNPFDSEASKQIEKELLDEYKDLTSNQSFLDGLSVERYFDDRSRFDLTANLMEAHALSELAKTYFDEGEFVEANATAGRALELFSAEGVTPSPYQVKESDAAGHRESQFGANLAKLVQIYSRFELATDNTDTEAAAGATLSFFVHWPSLEHLVWHFEDGGRVVMERGRFDPVDWPEGRSTRVRLTENLIQNLPALTNPKSSSKPWSQFEELGQVRAYWQDHERQSIFVTIEEEGQESFVLELAGGGNQPPQIPGNQLSLFGGGGDGRGTTGPDASNPNIRIPVAYEARKSYLTHLRNEVESASNDAVEVPYFAAMEEGTSMRFILPPRILEAAGVTQADEYNSFVVPKAALGMDKSAASSTEGLEDLQRVMQATQDMALTLYASPYGRLPGAVQDAADDMLFNLAEMFPAQAVFRDVYTDETTPRAIELVKSEFGKPEDFIILTAENDDDLRDWNVMGDLSDDVEALVELGMRDPTTISYNGSNAAELAEEFGGTDTRVIVLTAHAEQRLEDMLYDLGEAGAFRNNIVILVSCRTPITRNLTEYLGGAGADAVFPFDRVLDLKDGTAHEVTGSILNAIEEGVYANEPLWRAIPKIVERARTIPSISYFFDEFVKGSTSHG